MGEAEIILQRRKRRKFRKGNIWAVYVLFILSLFAGAWGLETFPGAQIKLAEWIEDKAESVISKETSKDISGETYGETFHETSDSAAVQTAVSLEEIPPFSGVPYVEVNGNIPYFEEADHTTDSFETYSELDPLGRCGTAYANVGKDLMPTQDREAIGSVKPSGWHTVKYDCVDGNYLYNRCHLIGYQLTGENANEKNLITGTRYMNVEGMLPFENAVDDFVEAANYHVLYRVTPVYTGDNLVADGVLMEGWSVEDGGRGICFCVYVYNCQPGVEIDYATGESRLTE